MLERRWHKPVLLKPLRADQVPDVPGVHVLLADPARLNTVLKIGPSRSLRRVFERECALDYSREPVRPTAMMWFESWADAEEAQRLIAEYRRRNGRAPALNSPY
jgi:hypothetical protein